MELQRINRIAASALWGMFALFMTFLLLALYRTGAAGTSPPEDPYLLVVVTALIWLAFLYHAGGTLAGAVLTDPGARTWALLDFGYGYRQAQGKLPHAGSLLVLAISGIILVVIVHPRLSLERAVLFVGCVAFLFILFRRWVYVYDPAPFTNEEAAEYFTQAELNDPLTRTVVISQPYEVAFERCLSIIDRLWTLPMAESDITKGTIDLMFRNSRLAFRISAAGDGTTRIIFSITNDLPSKWYPLKDRRESLRYLDQILALLAEPESP